MVLSTCWNISQLLPKYLPKLKIIWLPFRNRFNGQWLFCGFIVTGNLKFNEPTNKKYSKLPAACSSFTFPNASPIPDANGCCLNIKTSQFTNCAKLIALCKLNDLQTGDPHCHFIQNLWNSFFHTKSGVGQMPHPLPCPVQSSSLTVSHAGYQIAPLQVQLANFIHCSAKCLVFCFGAACQSDYRSQTR